MMLFKLICEAKVAHSRIMWGWPAMSAYIVIVWTTAASCFPLKKAKNK